MTEKKNLFGLVSTYGAVLLFVILAQTTLLSTWLVFNVVPLMTYAATVCTAMFEGEHTGSLFGGLLGLCIDATTGVSVGKNAILLMLVGYGVGSISRRRLLHHGVTALVLYVCAHVFLIVLDALLRLIVTANWVGYLDSLRNQLTVASVSAVYLPPFYWLSQQLNRFLGGGGVEAEA